jgi:hypothetical protein
VTADTRSVEQIFVVVAQDEVVAALTHHRQNFVRTRAERRNIPQASDLIDAALTDVVQNSAKRQLATMNVGDEGDSERWHAG